MTNGYGETLGRSAEIIGVVEKFLRFFTEQGDSALRGRQLVFGLLSSTVWLTALYRNGCASVTVSRDSRERLRHPVTKRLMAQPDVKSPVQQTGGIAPITIFLVARLVFFFDHLKNASTYFC
jgi:hypothetical protein